MTRDITELVRVGIIRPKKPEPSEVKEEIINQTRPSNGPISVTDGSGKTVIVPGGFGTMVGGFGEESRVPSGYRFRKVKQE